MQIAIDFHSMSRYYRCLGDKSVMNKWNACSSEQQQNTQSIPSDSFIKSNVPNGNVLGAIFTCMN